MPEINCSFTNDVVWGKPKNFGLDGAVHVYMLQFATHLHDIVRLTTLLNASEQHRADSYFHERDRQRFILSRGMLRLILGKYMGKVASEISFAIGPNKKPYVQQEGRRIQYNVAHTGDVAVIAISHRAVGVDVEKTATNFDYKEVLPGCFSGQETELVHNAANPMHAFYMLWTRKEALLKATGKGIDDDMAKVPCMDGIHTVEHNIIGVGEDIQVVSFEMRSGYVGSVAYSAGSGDVLFCEYEEF